MSCCWPKLGNRKQAIFSTEVDNGLVLKNNQASSALAELRKRTLRGGREIEFILKCRGANADNSILSGGKSFVRGESDIDFSRVSFQSSGKRQGCKLGLPLNHNRVEVFSSLSFPSYRALRFAMI